MNGRHAGRTPRVLCGAALSLVIMLAGSVVAAQPVTVAPAQRKQMKITQAHMASLARDTVPQVISRDDLRRRRVHGRLDTTTARLLRLYWDVPEYHDEQRLWNARLKEYGPMLNAWASPFSGRFHHVEQFNAHGAVGVFVAVLYVDTVHAVALPAVYSGFGLRGGLNCLYLEHQGAATGTGWRAYVSPSADDVGCPRPMAAPASYPLQVRASAPVGSWRDIPDVVRIDEDTEGRLVIGVRCLNRWCEIGQPGFVSRKQVHFANAFVQSAAPATRRHKAWYDDQRISDRAPDGTLRPGPRAVLLPAPGLETKAMADFEDFWTHVATIVLPEDPAGTKYARTWKMGQGENRIEIGHTGGQWYAQLQTSTGQTVPMNIRRHEHYDILVPGTARWRYLVTDDLVWVRCDQGCCMIWVPEG